MATSLGGLDNVQVRGSGQEDMTYRDIGLDSYETIKNIFPMDYSWTKEPQFNQTVIWNQIAKRNHLPVLLSLRDPDVVRATQKMKTANPGA